MQPKLFAQDKANHYVYGSLAAAVGAAAAMALLVLLGRHGLQMQWAHWLIALAGSVGAGVAALGAGLWKERRDQRANEEATLLNKPPPHEVSAADVNATAAGAVPVVVALLALALLGRV